MVTHCGPGGVVLGGLLSRSCPWRMGFSGSISVVEQGRGRRGCDHVPVFGEESLEMGKVWGVGCN